MTINFEMLKVSKMVSLKLFYFSSQEETRNIKFGQQVNLIQRVPLGTPLHDVLVSLPHNHVTLTISLSLVTGAIVITFKQLKQVLDKSP